MPNKSHKMPKLITLSFVFLILTHFPYLDTNTKIVVFTLLFVTFRKCYSIKEW